MAVTSVTGRARVARCTLPAHVNAAGDCTRWAHLPGGGRGPAKPRRRYAIRAAVMRNMKHVIPLVLLVVAYYVAVEVMLPIVTSGDLLIKPDLPVTPTPSPTGRPA